VVSAVGLVAFVFVAVATGHRRSLSHDSFLVRVAVRQRGRCKMTTDNCRSGKREFNNKINTNI